MNDSYIDYIIMFVLIAVIIAIFWKSKKHPVPPTAHDKLFNRYSNQKEDAKDYSDDLLKVLPIKTHGSMGAGESKHLGNYPPAGNQIFIGRQQKVVEEDDYDDLPTLGAGILLGALLSESSSSSSSGTESEFTGLGGSFAGGGSSGDFTSDTSSCGLDSNTSSGDCGAN